MEQKLKSRLKAITLDLRCELEGQYDDNGKWQPGNLERRLGEIGVWRDRPAKPASELAYRSSEDCESRRVVDAFLKSRTEAGLDRTQAVEEFVREAAYTWANRLLALRCMEVRGLIDEVILQKEVYAGRSLQHQRLAKKEPERCTGEDEGLFAALFDEFERRAVELPLLFNPRAPEVALRPSVAAIKRCIGLLSGTAAPKGQEPATDEVFSAPDALGWAYMYWNTEEKDRVFEKVRTKKGAKIEGAEIIPVTCIYTEPYIVKFLVQNSLGAIWMGMHPTSRLCDSWEYYVRGADRASVITKPVREITFLDPAPGSGHFLTEAFDLFYAMYLEEGELTDPAAICGAILEHNLYGIDIDERAVQIAALALVMKAKEKEKAPDFVPRRVNLVATNIRLPATKEHLDAFLRRHPEDAQLKPALLAIFEGLADADELGSLIQIEEPVEKELRSIKARYEAAGSPAEQRALWSQYQKPVQGKLPVGVASYDEWKEGALERIREHFDAEARGGDLGAAFFGEAGAKGVSLLDMLSRRYDVVATNPPYMGSKNMGPVLKRYVERHFAPGKRDLYAAFILRCLELAVAGGCVAMVTQQSWMFLRSYADLRAPDEEKLRNAPRAFKGVLRETTIEALVHLGEHAFAEAAAAGAFVALFVLARTEPHPGHSFVAFRLVGPKGPEEKDRLLREALREPTPVRFQPLQADILNVSSAPLSLYHLSPPYFRILRLEQFGEQGEVCQGSSPDVNKHVRWYWETSQERRGWVVYAKGGGYRKWYGCDNSYARWPLFRIDPKSTVRGESRFFREGLCYTTVARGKLGVRRLEADSLFSDASSGIFLDGGDLAVVAGEWNTHLFTFLARAVCGKLDFSENYLRRLPAPRCRGIAELVRIAFALKKWMSSLDPTERWFVRRWRTGGQSLCERADDLAGCIDATCAVLHAIEGAIESRVCSAYGLTRDDLKPVLDETGTPPAWFAFLLRGYEAKPPLPETLAVPSELLSPTGRGELRELAADKLTVLKQRLRKLYEAGPGRSAPVEDNSEASGDEEDEADAVAVSGARIPIPAETYLEELSLKLEVHPISVYWLLRELREKEGVVCPSELRRHVEDCVSVQILHLLGHRWPQQIESGERLPAWADADGIIPFTEGTGEPTLLERVRERIAEDFGPGRVNAIEQEFHQITGKPLGTWLATEFFQRHVSQFKKRPIAWHIESARSIGKRGRRGKGGAPPAFSCLVYYHSLDEDFLPKLRSQYVGPLRSRFQTELAGLERVHKRSADQDERRVQLEMLIEQLKDFDTQLEEIITTGFLSAALDAIGVKEPLDGWTSRDGQAPHPTTREAFLAQEQRYDPDLNDGVRVNIAPLQKAGLLAADVLAAKDIEKAIADRAEWRADERRWCREGKLPRPGWWPEGSP